MDRTSTQAAKPNRSTFERIADALFASALGIVGAALLVHQLCK